MTDNPYKYPDAVFDFEEHEQTNDVSDADAEDINVVYVELENIEAELGILAKKGGISALAGFSSVSKAIILKGTSGQRVSNGISYEAGQLFYQTDGSSLWKATVSTTGDAAGWEQITSAGVPGSHAASHGANSLIDPLGTALPSTIWLDDVNFIGTSNDFARADHGHEMEGAINSPIQSGDTPAVGSNTRPAREDHRHQTHANTPTSTMKNALAGIPSYPPTNDSDGAYAIRRYVDEQTALVAGLCLVAGNETIVESTSNATPHGAIVKSHRLVIHTTILTVTKVYVALDLRSATAGQVVQAYLYIDGTMRESFSASTTSYDDGFDAKEIDVTGIANGIHAVDLYLRVENAGNTAYNRVYEMYIK